VDKWIDRCLETLYKYTDKGSFYVYIIDQTILGLDATRLRNTYANLMVIRTPKSDYHYTGNLGHSQGSNLGIRLVETPYFTLLNDDVEFINKGWWQGVLDTFDRVQEATPDRPALLVNVGSLKLPDWSLGRASGNDFYILPHKKDYSQEDWDFLVNEDHYINEHLTLHPGSVIDGINLYCSVADTKKFLDVGMLDDRYFPGNANDYDYSCRAYMRGYRCVGTTLSWVYHHWSVTFHSNEDMQALDIPEIRNGDLNEKWGDRLDIWGVRCPECRDAMRTEDNKTAYCPKHPAEFYDIPQSKISPL